jgi:hypothetical protein
LKLAHGCFVGDFDEIIKLRLAGIKRVFDPQGIQHTFWQRR